MSSRAYRKAVFVEQSVSIGHKAVQDVGLHGHRVGVLEIDEAKRVRQAVDDDQLHLESLKSRFDL